MNLLSQSICSCDAAATRTRALPGFFNHKYRPASMVVTEFATAGGRWRPADFPLVVSPERTVASEVARASGVGSSTADRARRYIAAIPPAVAGQHGDVATFRVCCRLVRGFDLDEDQALSVLAEWNHACEPPWSERDLRAKLQAARRYGREPVGGLLAERSHGIHRR